RELLEHGLAAVLPDQWHHAGERHRGRPDDLWRGGDLQVLIKKPNESGKPDSLKAKSPVFTGLFLFLLFFQVRSQARCCARIDTSAIERSASLRCVQPSTRRNFSSTVERSSRKGVPINRCTVLGALGHSGYGRMRGSAVTFCSVS